jgi:hypothetical protein
MPFTPPPIIASDANYDAGPYLWSGQPTKRAPLLDQLAKGIIPGTKITGQLFNFLMNAFGARITELQTWADGDGDTRQIEIPFEWANTVLDSTGPEWTYFEPQELRRLAASGRSSVNFPLHALLPDGATITEISAVVIPGNTRTATNRIALSLLGMTLNRSTAGTAVATLATFEDDGTTNVQEIFLSDDVSGSQLPYTVDYATYPRLYASVLAGNTAHDDRLFSVRVTYEDAGPRSPGRIL